MRANRTRRGSALNDTPNPAAEHAVVGMQVTSKRTQSALADRAASAVSEIDLKDQVQDSIFKLSLRSETAGDD